MLGFNAISVAPVSSLGVSEQIISFTLPQSVLTDLTLVPVAVDAIQLGAFTTPNVGVRMSVVPVTITSLRDGLIDLVAVELQPDVNPVEVILNAIAEFTLPVTQLQPSLDTVTIASTSQGEIYPAVVEMQPRVSTVVIGAVKYAVFDMTQIDLLMSVKAPYINNAGGACLLGLVFEGDSLQDSFTGATLDDSFTGTFGYGSHIGDC